MGYAKIYRPSADIERYNESAEVESISASLMCGELDSLVLLIGFVSVDGSDSFLVSEMRLQGGGSQENRFCVEPKVSFLNRGNYSGMVLCSAAGDVDASQAEDFYYAFSDYRQGEKNRIRDSVNAVFVVAACDFGRLNRIKLSYGEYNVGNARQLTHSAVGLWKSGNLSDRGLQDKRAQTAKRIETYLVWGERRLYSWYDKPISDLYNLLKYPILMAIICGVFAPFYYIRSSRRYWRMTAVCAVVAGVTYSVPIILSFDEYYSYSAYLLFPPAILLVWAGCHVIWWYGYRNDSGESKK